MTNIKFTNEKGNVSVKARKHIKDSVIARITKTFEEGGLESIANADGGLSIAVATDEATGDTVYAHLAFTISTHDPMVQTAKSKKHSSAAVEVAMPDIFAATSAPAAE